MKAISKRTSAAMLKGAPARARIVRGRAGQLALVWTDKNFPCRWQGKLLHLVDGKGTCWWCAWNAATNRRDLLETLFL